MSRAEPDLLVDTSESMAYKSDKGMLSKLEYARHVAAAFAYLIIHQQDAVGLATFDSSVCQFLRPASTAAQLRQLCQTLEQSPKSEETQ